MNNQPSVNQLPLPLGTQQFQHHPTHWTNSIVHCDKERKQSSKLNRCTQTKTCKTLKTFFLQYY